MSHVNARSVPWWVGTLVLGLTGMASAQEARTIEGEYELRPVIRIGRPTARVVLRLERRGDVYDLTRTEHDARGKVLAQWTGQAKTADARTIVCEIPARRGLAGVIRQDEPGAWGARARYRFLREGRLVIGSFSRIDAEGQVRETTHEHGTRTRPRPDQEPGPNDDPGDVPPPVIYGEEIEDGLHVRCFRSLVFMRATDPSEHEARPTYDLSAVRDCLGTPPTPGTNRERWGSRQWPLVAHESGTPGTGSGTTVTKRFRLVVNEQNGPLFAQQNLFSDWQPWNGICEYVTPDLDTGLRAGGYTTRVEVAGAEKKWRGGQFFVSRLDAHGTSQDTNEKFPDFAEVLPKRSGLLSAPVIQMDFGGDASVAGCSLYGTRCSPAANLWQLTAIAKHPLTGQNAPPGYTLQWSGIPGQIDVIARSASGQPLTIQFRLPPGRYTPTLTVTGSDPYTGGPAAVLGMASIHSLVVEEKPTAHVAVKGPDVGQPAGAPFHLTNDLGGAKLAVDAMLGVRGPQGTGTLAVRGRVSLDGYPQNEYWVGPDDVADLPQVVSVPSGVAQRYYVQGYQLASANEADLALQVHGQAQLESKDDTKLYFDDPTPCGQVPPVPDPVTVVWQSTDEEPFSSTYPIEYTVDEEELKYQEEEDSPDLLEVFADHVASDYRGGGADDGHEAKRGYMGRVNYVASIRWSSSDVHVDYLTSDQLTIRWHFSANRSNRHCRDPGLLDLKLRQPLPQRGGMLDARADGLVSRVQLDFTATLAGDTSPKAKAGERFWIAPHGVVAHSDLGERFWKRREVVVIPGEKVFHITLPNRPTPAERQEIASFDPSSIFEMTRAQMASSAYARWRWTCPIDSGSNAVLQVFCFDVMGNMVPAGRPLSWMLDGGGYLGAYDPSRDPRPHETRAQEAEGVTLANGEARIRFRQDRYPHCSWQVVDRPDPSVVFLSIDGSTEVVNASSLTTDRRLPSPGPELVVLADFLGANDQLDIARGDSAPIEATVFYRTPTALEPVEDVTVSFLSTNGRLAGGDGHGRVKTNAQGKARIRLTSADARLTHDGYGEIIVTASVANKRSSVRTDAPPGTTVTQRPRWVNSSAATLRLEHPVLVWDAAADGTTDVETLPGRGNVSSEVLRVPHRVRARAIVKGPPNHRFVVSIHKRSTTPPPRARYAFDAVAANGTTPNFYGLPAAAVAGARLAQQRQEGTHSLEFSGADSVTIPDTPAVDARGGVQVSFWVRPTGTGPAVLLERPGQYRLELLADRKLRLQAGNAGPPLALESDVALPNGQWSFVEVRVSERQLKLAWGDRPGAFLAKSRAGPSSFQTATVPVVVGAQLRGNLDDLVFEKGFEDVTQIGTGLVVVGGALGAGGAATVTTDASGRAEFWVGAAAPADPNDYRPVVIDVEIVGSPEARARAFALRRDIHADMYSIGHAFLYGEESLPGGHAHVFNDPQPEDVAAWLSNMVPVLANLRDLYLEFDKAATGCDSVSWLNVTFAVVGLAVDIATLGSGSIITGPLKSMLKSSIRPMLKYVVKSVGIDLALRGALELFSRLITVEVMTAEGERRATAPWVTDCVEYLAAIKAWLEDQNLRELVNAGFRSTDDLFLGLHVYLQLGADGVKDILLSAKEAEEVGVVQHLRRVPAVIGGGEAELLGGIGSRLATLSVGPWDPVKALAKRSKVIRESMRMAKKYAKSLGLKNDPEARRGLLRMCELVTHRPRAGDTAILFTRRLEWALDHLDDAGRRLLLREFDTSFALIVAMPQPLRAEQMKKLAEVVDTFATRFKHFIGPLTVEQLRGYRSRVKGGAYHLQHIHDELVKDTLRQIEPAAPNGDPSLFRDLLAVILQGIESFKELKNVLRYSGAALSHQVGSHFAREVKVSSIGQLQARFKPLAFQGLRQFSDPIKKRVRAAAVAAIIEHNPLLKKDEAAVRVWVRDNVRFLDEVPMRYTGL